MPQSTCFEEVHEPSRLAISATRLRKLVEDDDIQQGVSTETIRAVNRSTGGFTCGKESWNDGITVAAHMTRGNDLAVVVGDAAHVVVDSRESRNRPLVTSTPAKIFAVSEMPGRRSASSPLVNGQGEDGCGPSGPTAARISMVIARLTTSREANPSPKAHTAP